MYIDCNSIKSIGLATLAAAFGLHTFSLLNTTENPATDSALNLVNEKLTSLNCGEVLNQCGNYPQCLSLQDEAIKLLSFTPMRILPGVESQTEMAVSAAITITLFAATLGYIYYISSAHHKAE